jgi:hypothetical protein
MTESWDRTDRLSHQSKLRDMKTAALIPVEEYLRTVYRPDCDYVDGEVLERNLGELDHSDLQSEFVHYFRGHRRKGKHTPLLSSGSRCPRRGSASRTSA